jgi:hypothetical protein
MLASDPATSPARSVMVCTPCTTDVIIPLDEDAALTISLPSTSVISTVAYVVRSV